MHSKLAKIESELAPMELISTGTDGIYLIPIPDGLLRYLFGSAIDKMTADPRDDDAIGTFTLTGGLTLPGHAQLAFTWKYIARKNGHLYWVIQDEEAK